MFTTNPVLLKALLRDVESGKIQLPDFQRGWIWDDDRIRGLLASISKGFPVGAIMTLSAGSDIKFKSRQLRAQNRMQLQAGLLPAGWPTAADYSVPVTDSTPRRSTPATASDKR